MGVQCWKSGGPALLMVPNVTALLLLAGAFLMLNWPQLSIRTTAIKLNRNGLLSDKLDKMKNCSQPCYDGARPKECYFKFVLEPFVTISRDCWRCSSNDTRCKQHHCVPADGFERTMLTVNRQLPGTPVHVCEGDIVVVDVENHLPGIETSIHWHGQPQRGTPFMDGTPMITQCPIQSDTRFRYKFRASNPGTHFYHSHSVSHHADGIFGPFIVRQAPSREPHFKLYDYDLNEHVISILPWSHSVLAYNLDFQENLKISSLLINGKGNFYNNDTNISTDVPRTKFMVRWGHRYRFRIINAASLDCPVHFKIEGHNLTIIATDGSPVNPTETSHLILYPGERYDVVLDARQEVLVYWIQIRGQHKCQDVHQEALLVYEGATVPSDSRDLASSLEAHTSSMMESCPQNAEASCTMQQMRSIQRFQHPERQETRADRTLYVPFDVYSYDNLDDQDINFNFTLEDTPYYPSYLYKRNRPVRLPQVSGLTFSYPPSPLLSQPEDVPSSMMCANKCKKSDAFCECLHIMHVPFNISLDIILVDQGRGSNQSNTFHLHGYTFYVLGSKSLDHIVDLKDIKTMDKQGRLHRNLQDPPRKDTVVVPNKGYIILRILTDNPGYWLFEGRSMSPVISEGLQFVLHVGDQSHLPSIPSNFPRCGILKGPNFIL